MIDSLGTAFDAHATVSVEQLGATFSGKPLQRRTQVVEAIDHLAHEVRGLVGRNIGLRLGGKERFSFVGSQSLGILGRAGEGQQLSVLGQQGPLQVANLCYDMKAKPDK
jgi:hypothetical protein